MSHSVVGELLFCRTIRSTTIARYFERANLALDLIIRFRIAFTDEIVVRRTVCEFNNEQRHSICGRRDELE